MDPRILRKVVAPGVHLIHGFSDADRAGIFAFEFLDKIASSNNGFSSDLRGFELWFDGPANVTKIGQRCDTCFQGDRYICECEGRDFKLGCDFDPVFSTLPRSKVRMAIFPLVFSPLKRRKPERRCSQKYPFRLSLAICPFALRNPGAAERSLLSSLYTNAKTDDSMTMTKFGQEFTKLIARMSDDWYALLKPTAPAAMKRSYVYALPVTTPHCVWPLRTTRPDATQNQCHAGKRTSAGGRPARPRART